MNRLIPLEFKNQRIMTTKTLAEEYGTNEQNISKNFTRNSERFIEGKHYFRLEGEELKQFKGYVLNDESLKFVSVLYLWTEKGAARHAKILDTDEAWEVYEALEETYFRVKENSIAISQLSPELQMFKTIFDKVAQQELEQKQIVQAVQQTKEEVQAIREVVEISPKNNWREEANKIVSKICRKLNDYRKPKEDIYAALEQRAHCNLKTRLNNLRGRAFNNCWSQSKINTLNNLDVIADDIKLIEIYTAIVKEMAIKYKIA